MKYRNTKTGAVIETDCKISGEHWEKFKPTPKEKKSADGETAGNDEG